MQLLPCKSTFAECKGHEPMRHANMFTPLLTIVSLFTLLYFVSFAITTDKGKRSPKGEDRGLLA